MGASFGSKSLVHGDRDATAGNRYMEAILPGQLYIKSGLYALTYYQPKDTMDAVCAFTLKWVVALIVCSPQWISLCFASTNRR